MVSIKDNLPLNLQKHNSRLTAAATEKFYNIVMQKTGGQLTLSSNATVENDQLSIMVLLTIVVRTAI